MNFYFFRHLSIFTYDGLFLFELFILIVKLRQIRLEYFTITTLTGYPINFQLQLIDISIFMGVSGFFHKTQHLNDHLQ